MNDIVSARRKILLRMVRVFAPLLLAGAAPANAQDADPVAHLPALDMVTVGTADIGASVAFYRDRIGLRIVDDHVARGAEASALMVPRGRSARVVLLQEPEPGKVRHALVRLVQIGRGPVREHSWDRGGLAMVLWHPERPDLAAQLSAPGSPCGEARYGKTDDAPPVSHEIVCHDPDGTGVFVFGIDRAKRIEGVQWIDIVTGDVAANTGFYAQGLGFGTVIAGDYRASSFTRAMGFAPGTYLHNSSFAPGRKFDTRLLLFEFRDATDARVVGRPIPRKGAYRGLYMATIRVEHLAATLDAVRAHGGTLIYSGETRALVRSPDGMLIEIVAPSAPPRVAAVTLGVADMDKAIRFYRDLVGMDLVQGSATSKAAVLRQKAPADAPRLADLRLVAIGAGGMPNVPPRSALTAGMVLMAFRDSDVPAAKARISSAGFDCTLVDYAKINGKSMDGTFETVCGDPDGNRIAIFTVKDAPAARGVNWVDLAVADAERSLPFYQQGLGFPVKIQADFKTPEFRNLLKLPPGVYARNTSVAPFPHAPTRLCLFDFHGDDGALVPLLPATGEGVRRGAYLVTIAVADVAATLAEAVRHGGTVIRRGPEGGAQTALLRSPDGFLFEIVADGKVAGGKA